MDHYNKESHFPRWPTLAYYQYYTMLHFLVKCQYHVQCHCLCFDTYGYIKKNSRDLLFSKWLLYRLLYRLLVSVLYFVPNLIIIIIFSESCFSKWPAIIQQDIFEGKGVQQHWCFTSKQSSTYFFCFVLSKLSTFLFQLFKQDTILRQNHF